MRLMRALSMPSGGATAPQPAWPAVAHIMDTYLGATETFIHDYLTAFERLRAVIIARRFENLDLFPMPASGSLHRWRPRRGTPSWAIASMKRRLPGMSGADPSLEKTLAAQQVRLMHAHFGPTACDLLDVRRRTGIPLVTSFYGYDASMSEVVDQFRDRYRRLFDIGDAFLAEGPAMAARLEGLGCPSSKLRIQRIGIDPMKHRFRVRKDPGTGPLRLLMCGRMVPKKGHAVALGALAEARRHDKRLRLVLIGDGPLRADIERQITALDLTDAVSLMGRRPRQELLHEMENAHIYLQPSMTAGDGDSEGGAPTSLLEAQASGLPTLATRHADIPQVVREGESALLSPEGDVGGLAANMVLLAGAPQRWGSMGRSGRAHVEAHHDVRSLATQLEIRYATLAETGRL